MLNETDKPLIPAIPFWEVPHSRVHPVDPQQDQKTDEALGGGPVCERAVVPVRIFGDTPPTLHAGEGWVSLIDLKALTRSDSLKLPTG